MPHFIIECNESLINAEIAKKIMECVFNTAEKSTLFNRVDIKVRILPYQYTLYDKNDFVHIFAYIFEGRTNEQKNILVKDIISNLKILLPNVPLISIQINDINKIGYHNSNIN